MPMVIKGSTPEKTLEMKHPTKLSELTESPHNKFIIKFGASYCPPCRKFQEYLDKADLSPKTPTTIYMVQLDGEQDAIADELRKFFSFRSIPYTVVTDKHLQLIEDLKGFNEQGFKSMFEKHFCQ